MASMIMTLKPSDWSRHMYFSIMTEEMDRHMQSDLYTEMFGKATSFWGIEEGTGELEGHHVCVFRVPGATRGCLVLSENDVIERIVFYENQSFNSEEKGGCYNRSVIEAVQKYIGYKLVIQQ